MIETPSGDTPTEEQKNVINWYEKTILKAFPHTSHIITDYVDSTGVGSLFRSNGEFYIAQNNLVYHVEIVKNDDSKMSQQLLESMIKEIKSQPELVPNYSWIQNLNL